jgi:hypothetical protein
MTLAQNAGTAGTNSCRFSDLLVIRNYGPIEVVHVISASVCFVTQRINSLGRSRDPLSNCTVRPRISCSDKLRKDNRHAWNSVQLKTHLSRHQLAVVITKDNGRRLNVLAALATASRNCSVENHARLCAYTFMPCRSPG